MENLVIIGASDAGISAALRAREIDTEITPVIIESGRFPNYSICGLPYFISHEVEKWENLAHRTIKEIKAAGIRLLLENTVQSVDTENKQLAITGKNGDLKTMGYDKLVIATGGLSVKPEIPGLNYPGVFFLRWIPESIAIDKFINKRKPKTAVIIGAGYIGMEMSEALTRRGIKVTVIEFAESVLPSFDGVIGNRIRDMLIKKGIEIYNNINVKSIDGSGRIDKKKNNKLDVSGSGNFQIASDMVLVSAGSSPNASIGRTFGISTGIKGALKVNLKMATNIPDVYAAGDCVETWHRILERYTYLPLGTTAHKQGRIAGENAAGGGAEFAGSLGTQAVKIFDCVAARTGLNEKEAIQAGFQSVSADIETWDHKKYYPGAEKLFIRVTADRITKRILGAQIFGPLKTEVSKRIDIFAAALFHGVTVNKFSDYDLSYTPPLSSPWDPVQMAVQSIEKLL